MVADALRAEVEAIQPRLVAWRRDLHRHPELGFEETRTAAFVESQLREAGIEVRSGVARTGVIGLLRAARATGPAVLLRADMDALPVQEVDGREYGSTIAGRMHACGHDGHTAMLVGAARILAARRESLPRDVVFCFQPAEEGPGGAVPMIEAGVLDFVETGAVFALHLWSLIPAGRISLRAGSMMAATDEFEVRIVGRGGHGAEPHRTRDPIVAAAHAIAQLQSIVARSVDPLDAAVVTVGSLHAGAAPNVIPHEARMSGTLRSFTEPVRETLRLRSREVVENAAAAAGCGAEFTLKPGYCATVNDAAAVDRVRRIATANFGAERVVEGPPMAAGEDFGYFLRERPGAFILLGAGNVEHGIIAPHHAPEFDIDESALAVGTELWVRLALEP